MDTIKLTRMPVLVLGLLIAGCAAQRLAVTPPPAATAVATDTAHAQALFVDGALHDMRQEYADAILEYLEALKYDRSASILFVIAKDYAALHKPERAAQYANAAIALDSSNTEYRMLRAEIALTLQGDFDEAQRQLERIIALDSNNIQALSDLADLAQLRGKTTVAIALYERILDVTGDDAEVSLHLAQLYNAIGELQRSVHSLQDALKDEADNPDLRESIAQTYVEMHQLDSAACVYDELLVRFPNAVGAQFARANLYAERGKWDSALTAYARLLANDSLARDTEDEILDSLYTHCSTDTASFAQCTSLIVHRVARDSQNWFARVMLGGAMLSHGQDAEGLLLIHDAIATAADKNAALLTGGQVLLDNHRNREFLDDADSTHCAPDYRIAWLRSIAFEQLHNQADALAALHVSLQLNPRGLMALVELGEVYDELHLSVQSDSAYDAALAIRPDFALALNNYSYSLAERGDRLQQAKIMAQRANMIDSGNVSYMDTFAWVYYKLGEYDSALVWIRSAVAQGKTPPTVLEHYGDIAIKLGQNNEALQLWNQALQQDTTNDALRQKISTIMRKHGGE